MVNLIVFFFFREEDAGGSFVLVKLELRTIRYVYYGDGRDKGPEPSPLN